MTILKSLANFFKINERRRSSFKFAFLTVTNTSYIPEDAEKIKNYAEIFRNIMWKNELIM